MIIKRKLTKRMLAAFSAICLMMGSTPGITAMAAQEPVSETESFDIDAAEEPVEVISEDAGQPAEAVSDAEESTGGEDEGLAEETAEAAGDVKGESLDTLPEEDNDTNSSWRQNDADWYTNYEYHLDPATDEYPYIWLTKAKGECLDYFTGHVVVSSNAIINGKTYRVGLDVGDGSASIWAPVSYKLTGLKFGDPEGTYDTVYAGKNTSCLFYQLEGVEVIDARCLYTNDVTDMCQMFGICPALTNLILEDESRAMETVNVTDMSGMFEGCTILQELDLTGFNTSKVKDMSDMFSGCKSLKSILFSHDLDTSNVRDMSNMFYACKELRSIPCTSMFDTSRVEDMAFMFGFCSGLEYLDVSSFNTENVKNFTCMFCALSSLYTLDLRSFDISAAQNVKNEDFDPFQAMVSYFDIYSSGISTLILPKATLSGYDFNASSDDIALTTIKYAGSESEWTALNNTGLEGVTVEYDYSVEMEFSPLTKILYPSFDRTTGVVSFTPDTSSGYYCVTLYKDGKEVRRSEITEINDDKVSVSFMDEFLEEGNGSYDYVISWTYSEDTKLKNEEISKACGYRESGMLSWYSYHLGTEVVKGSYEYNMPETRVPAPSNLAVTYNTGHYYLSCDLDPLADADRLWVAGIALDENGVEKHSPDWRYTAYSIGNDLDTVISNAGDHPYGLSFTAMVYPKDMSLYRESIWSVRVLVVNDEVAEPVAASSLAIKSASTGLSLPVGTSEKLECSISPENATTQTITWESSDPTIVKVNKEGFVSGLKAGTATVTAYATDGSGKSASVEVTVGGDWLDHYNFKQDRFNKRIYLHSSKGTLTSEEITIPATAVIGSETYEVWLERDPESDIYNPHGIWYEDLGTIKKINISDGVKVAEDGRYLFYGLYDVSSMDVGKLDTSYTEEFDGMFASMTSLKSLDISNLDTSRARSMESMFRWDPNLEEIKLGKNFKTGNVKTMRCMFENAKSLKAIDVSGFDTSNVEEFVGMFEGCESLTSLDVSSFNTSKCWWMSGMFRACKKLRSLDLRGFDFHKANTGDLRVDAGGNNHYVRGMFEDSGIVNLYLPAEKPLRKYDFTITVSNEYEGGNYWSALKTIYFTGTEEQWNALDNTLPAGVKVVYGYTGKINPDPTDPVNPDPVDPVNPTPVDPTPAKPDLSESSLDPVPVIDENTTELYLVKGQKFTLPEKGWKSNNKSIIVISKKGELKAKKNTPNTPVSIKNGDRTIKVYVTDPIIEKKHTLEAGSEYTISFDYDKEHLGVSWFSNNPDVATVSGNGVVTAVSKGNAVISAFINGVEYKCKLKVTEKTTKIERTLHLNCKQSKKISIKGIKADKIKWTISGNETTSCINKIKKNSIKAGGKPGKETLIGTYDGKTYIVHVYVEDITVTTPGVGRSGSGNNYKLTVKTTDKVAIKFAQVYQNVWIKSSRPEIAAAQTDGTLRIRKAGKTKLKAKINGKTINITVKVE